MSSSNLIATFLGKGVFASRPPTPAVPTAATAVYYATDTIHLYVWTGAAWQLIF